MGIKSYWSQVFLLPKKNIKKLESICWQFLWSGSNDNKIVPITWSIVCLPKLYGGYGVNNFHIWNKTAILKQLWAICHKKDRLWVRWLHVYYIIGKPLEAWNIPLDVSCMLRKVVSCREQVTNWGAGQLWRLEDPLI